MAEFPPNLDDGELWLPSDIFLNEVPSKHGLHHFSCVDDLAQRLATLTFLKQRNLPQPPLKTPPKRFGPVPVQENPFSNKSFKLSNGFDNGHHLYECKRVHNHGDSDDLFYQSKLLKPVQSQVGVFLETRARVLQKQQNRLQNRPLSSRVSGFGVGGFVRVSGGTGVFHPRVLNTTNSPSSTAFSSSVVKKKQVLRRRPEIQVFSQRNCTRAVGVNKEDFRLPPDWTY